MSTISYLAKAPTLPPLDPDFRPAILANRAFLGAVYASGQHESLVIGLERGDGSISRFETVVFGEESTQFDANFVYAERLVKFLLWQRGACTIYVGGPKRLGHYIAECYAIDGLRDFDRAFMGDSVYAKPFEVVVCDSEEVPNENESSTPLGRHLEGCRIGFDLGASDRKVSAVIDGETVYSEEVVWEPRQHSDPAYHYNEVMTALKTAASKLPRVDAIGGSSAGVYVNNRAMIASLFRGISEDQFHVIRDMFINIGDEFGVPIAVVNDGDVTALAGSMSLDENSILGIALGSSEAGGYVNHEGNITGWLNELAFCPVDYNPDAARDEWSGDYGVGAQYFSQQAVFRLAPSAGINLPVDTTDAERLAYVQGLLQEGHEGARDIWRTIGTYLGYTLPHYADFYEINHVLLLGRCMSGVGGDLILATAQDILTREFSEVAESLTIQLPDEKSRRVGQSIAAASLPQIEP